MANVGTLTVQLSANSAALVAEFAKTQRRSKTFAQKVQGNLRTVGTVFTRLAGVAGTALIGVSAASIKAADDLAKTSAKLGIAADELAGLRFAAEQTGVSTRKLDLGLQRFVRRAAEAAQGTGEARNAIKELGLDARDLASQSPDEAFRTLADAFSQVGSQSDRVRLGFKLFDSEGVALVNTLAAGRTQLDAFSAEARRLGLALDPQQLTNIQDAADAQNRLAKAFAGLGRQIGATLAPAFEEAADAATALVSRLTEIIPKLAGIASAVFGIRREASLLTRNEVREELTQVFQQLDKAKADLDQARKLLQSQADPSSNISAQDNFRRAAEDAAEDVAELVARSAELQARFRELSVEEREAANAAVELTAALGEIPEIKVVNFEATAIDEIIERMDQLRGRAAGIFEATRTPIERFRADMAEAIQLLEQGFIDADTFNRFNLQLQSGLQEATVEVQQKADEMGGAFGNAFGDAIIQGKGFSDVLKTIAQDLLSLFVRSSLNPIGQAIFGSFGGIFGGPKANGGPVSAGTSYLVGERGPEMFVPNVSGKIIPNGSLGTGSGVVINQTINATGADSDMRRALPVLFKQSEQAIILQVQKLARQGRLT